eukprot:GFUD01001639.1.p1 GENE.GFUD01001639.1~~GFUD01001639.1.p1  ORF type:complete len:552 (+),score=175.64 GFUD01001639.1:52-1707(+)
MEVEVSTDKEADIEDILEDAGDSFEISKVVFHQLNQSYEVDSTRDIEFVDSLKIGRSSVSPNPSENQENGLFDSKVLSRSHAVISYKGDKFYIQDLNSSNGTFINKFNMEPMREEEIYSEDVLQFGTRVGLHDPVRVRVDLFCPKGEKFATRGTDCEDLGTITERDILELNKAIEEAGASEAAIKNKLTALEAIIEDFKDLHDRNKIEKEFLEKIKNIENTLETLKTLETSKSRTCEEINISIRMILVEVIQEIILDQSLGDGKQKNFLQLMITKLKKNYTEEDSYEEYNVTITKSPASTLRHTKSPDRVLSPIVFYQDDEIEGMEPEEEFQIRHEHVYLDIPKGILKAPNSPRSSVKLIRINVIPEVREIENCLQDRGYIDMVNLAQQIEEESPEPNEDKENITDNGPRRRSWVKKKEETNLFDPVELRDKLYKISNKDDIEKEKRNDDDSTEGGVPIQEKLEEIKSQIDRNKSDTDEQFEKTQNGIQEVQDQVGEVCGVINRIVTQFGFSIQGFFFCFIFGIIVIGIGLKSIIIRKLASKLTEEEPSSS